MDCSLCPVTLSGHFVTATGNDLRNRREQWSQNQSCLRIVHTDLSFPPQHWIPPGWLSGEGHGAAVLAVVRGLPWANWSRCLMRWVTWLFGHYLCHVICLRSRLIIDSNQQTGSPKPCLDQAAQLTNGYSVLSGSRACWVLVVQMLTEETSLCALCMCVRMYAHVHMWHEMTVQPVLKGS